MAADTLFSLMNLLAISGWILLAIAPLWKHAERIANGVVATILCIVYAVLVIKLFQLKDLGQFGSLQGVKSLFRNDYVLLAGWVHYLAFDLLIGCWIYQTSRLRKLPHSLFLICASFTFILGPCGLLIFLLMRVIQGKTPQKLP